MANMETVMLIERLAEEFSEMKTQDIYRNRRKLCRKCKYRGQMGTKEHIYCNWSSLNQKNFRDCSPINCKYFEKGKMLTDPKRQKYVKKNWRKHD